MSNQNVKTIEYWDAFYSSLPSADATYSSMSQDATAAATGSSANADNDETPSRLEWIVPYSVVLDSIVGLLPPSGHSNQTRAPNNTCTKQVHLLEIGCGVSQLSISLLQRLLRYRQSTPSYDIHCTYHFVATDVSSVCIDNNRERDSAYSSSISNKGNRISYEILDVLRYEASSSHNQQYDMILDKGTLDTFLFRSKRTEKGSNTYPPLLTPLLNNIHRWLRCECSAKYIIISPRSKIKSVRDFRGFASVRRMKIDTTPLISDVVLVKGNSDISQMTKSEVYLYECIKNDGYTPDFDVPYRDMECNAKGESLCPTCGINFKEFLGKVDAKDQGEAVWTRKWKNHCLHCKNGNNVDTSDSTL